MPERKRNPVEELEHLRHLLDEVTDLSDKLSAWGYQPSKDLAEEFFHAYRVISLAMDADAADLRLRIAVQEGII